MTILEINDETHKTKARPPAPGPRMNTSGDIGYANEAHISLWNMQMAENIGRLWNILDMSVFVLLFF